MGDVASKGGGGLSPVAACTKNWLCGFASANIINSLHMFRAIWLTFGSGSKNMQALGLEGVGFGVLGNKTYGMCMCVDTYMYEHVYVC